MSYVDPADHYDFHPQLPQVLGELWLPPGRARHQRRPGHEQSGAGEKIRWRGLDGTEIDAVPRYEGIPETTFYTDLKVIKAADELGYRQVLLGRTVDATAEWAEERPHTLIDPVAPIAGTWVTVKEFFAKTPPPSKAISSEWTTCMPTTWRSGPVGDA